LTTIIAFEIQKARRKVTATQTRLLVPPDSTLFRKLPMRFGADAISKRDACQLFPEVCSPDCRARFAFLLDSPRTTSSALKTHRQLTKERRIRGTSRRVWVAVTLRRAF